MSNSSSAPQFTHSHCKQTTIQANKGANKDEEFEGTPVQKTVGDI